MADLEISDDLDDLAIRPTLSAASNARTLGIPETADEVYERAGKLLRAGDFHMALVNFNTVFDILKEKDTSAPHPDPSLPLAAHSGRGTCLTALGEKADALQAHGLVLSMAVEKKMRDWEATALGGLADAYASGAAEGGEEEVVKFAAFLAENAARGGVERLDKAGVGQGTVPHLHKLLAGADISEWVETDIFLSVSNFEKMAAVAANMRRKGRALLVRSLGSLGSLYRHLGQFTLSTRLLESALDLASTLDDRAAIAACCSGLGLAYSGWALEYIRESVVAFCTYSCLAIDWHLRAKAAFHLLGDLFNVQVAHMRVAGEHSEQKANHKAIEHLNFALLAECHRQIGCEFQTLAQHRQAIKEHEQDLELSLRQDDAQAEGQACRNLGVSYVALKQFAKGLKLLRHAERVAQSGSNWAAAALAMNEIGEGLRQDGQVDAAAASFTSALDLVDQHRLGVASAEKAALGAGDACLKLGHFVEALHFYDRHLHFARHLQDTQLQARAQINVSNATYWISQRWGGRPDPNVTQVMLKSGAVSPQASTSTRSPARTASRRSPAKKGATRSEDAIKGATSARDTAPPGGQKAKVPEGLASEAGGGVEVEAEAGVGGGEGVDAGLAEGAVLDAGMAVGEGVDAGVAVGEGVVAGVVEGGGVAAAP
ncbi:hypothetical protein T484DRAFT_1760283 [Baffinella frigidus]|nr:hypothetical protein T484DRAFT_1760283 [Cryptophyta sp. CCMP2293]